ncbi:MAG TPA: beta-ketoacyl-ACP synthase 3 [Solirubrobacteraceae bacterium]|nr:beta-ketoacyl-ACP synthase 3 [Solirubrobacteraceae bacterium]
MLEPAATAAPAAPASAAVPGNRTARGRLRSRNAGALGIGVALPERVVANDRVADAIGVSQEWIVRRTGIAERRHALAGARLSELAADAGAAALADAGLPAQELALLILATFTADAIIPPASASVAHLLGATGAATFDLNNACAGFISGLAAADALIGAGGFANALVIGAEIVSRHLDPSDRNTAAVFGDGAGSIVIAGDAPGGFGPFAMGADGSQAQLITIDHDSRSLRMDGHETFKQAVARLSEVALQACEAAGVELGEIDVFVFHQANSRITAALGERLGVDPAKVVDCIATLGNTSAASIPLALAHARRNGQLRKGDKALLAAVGAGFTWGATVVEWEAP